MPKLLSDQEHQKRLEVYQLGLTDRECGEIVGCSTAAYQDWRLKHIGKKQARTPTGGWDPPETLCWRCREAYANKCLATSPEERTWVIKKLTRKIRGISKTWRVLECTRFYPDLEEGDR